MRKVSNWIKAIELYNIWSASVPSVSNMLRERVINQGRSRSILFTDVCKVRKLSNHRVPASAWVMGSWLRSIVRQRNRQFQVRSSFVSLVAEVASDVIEQLSLEQLEQLSGT